MRWIDDDPTHRMVEDSATGTRAPLGPHAIAILDLFGQSRSVDEVLASLLPGQDETAEREKARETLINTIRELAELRFLLPAVS